MHLKLSFKSSCMKYIFFKQRIQNMRQADKFYMKLFNSTNCWLNICFKSKLPEMCMTFLIEMIKGCVVLIKFSISFNKTFHWLFHFQVFRNYVSDKILQEQCSTFMGLRCPSFDELDQQSIMQSCGLQISPKA